MTKADAADPLAERKADLRRRVRDARRSRATSTSDAERAVRARRLADAVAAHPAVAAACRNGEVITAFASLPTEPPTEMLLAAAHHAGARVLLPLVRANRTLEWAWYSPTSRLEPAALGIVEPVDQPVATTPDQLLALNPRVLLMPALAVDETRSRLGQGGGYYDTLLTQLPPHEAGGPLRLVIVGADEVWPGGTIPVDDRDQPIDEWLVG